MRALVLLVVPLLVLTVTGAVVASALLAARRQDVGGAAAPGAAPGTDPGADPDTWLPPTRSVPAAFAAARRHAAVSTVLAWCALVVTAWALQGATRQVGGLTAGLLVGLTPTLAGAAFLAVHGAGELTWPRPTGAVRRATLAPRHVADLAPRGLRRFTWALGIALLVVLAVGTFTAAPDGRSVTVAHSDTVTAGAGPYPGWYYALPLAVAGVVVLGGSEAVLRLVARRPAVADTSTEDDHRLRRASCSRVLAGVQCVLGGTLAGVLTFAGLAAHNAARVGGTTGDQITPTLRLVGTLGSTAALLGTAVLVTVLVVAAWTLATSGVAGRARPAPSGSPAPPAAAASEARTA